MIYAFICEDAEDSLALRRTHRPDHLARLNALRDEGRLLVAGPHPALDCEDPGEAGFTGSLILAEFPSLETAREWAAMDPFARFGVYRKVTVKPFRKVLP